MLGAIAGDIIGSVHEGAGTKHREFPLFTPQSTFTDDSVLCVAVAEVLLSGGNFIDAYPDYFHRYPDAGFGGGFARWAASRSRHPYYSWGNGSAMRVPPVGFAATSLEEALSLAKRSAEVTHDHPEGIRGAQAVAAAIFLARQTDDKASLRHELETRFGYDLSPRLDEIRPGYGFDVSCQGSVPPSIIAFLEADGVESAIRNAISLGGDADTQACMAGAMAEAFHGGLPESLRHETLARLPNDLRQVVEAFEARYR
ncbi:ADP-ribosylglycohydrolase family protein [Halomonas eurihalina]|uniref:ADP-ribosylglycohydrolase family protein n=1 Tax=Halomonas eurihalina TaxID=42566 RepID=A0A5D9CWF9_HALER|nr:ADP-ribosylglycohydrolase family protein [Halomonas eurihalina]MDR5860872.1 ADP-ribosylglycohydrolase family protein [Halomonas eurihalina]TZG35859.1 ADP-ribosylglycohydrolase family protein [Halomonas eurihalina]